MDESTPPKDDPLYEPTPDELREFMGSGRNYNKYPQLIEMIMRYRVPVNAAVGIINGYLADCGMEDRSHFITPSKLRRLMAEQGLELVEDHDVQKTHLSHFGVDGKKSKTRMPKNQWKVMDKATYMDQSERSYVDHDIPKSGSGLDNANSFVKVRFTTIFVYISLGLFL